MDEATKTDRREIGRIMFDEVLEKTIYPKVEYKSSCATALKTGENMNRVNFAGDLALHGITRDMGPDAQVVAREDTLRPQTCFSLMPSDDG